MPVLALKGSALALAAVVFMFSCIPFGFTTQVQINGYQDETFWGVMYDYGEEIPVILQLNGQPAEEKQKDPPTPGKVKITFKKKGEDVQFEYNRDIGAGEISQEEEERIDKVIDAVLKYSEKTVEGKTVPRRVVNWLKNMKLRPEPIFFKKI